MAYGRESASPPVTRSTGVDGLLAACIALSDTLGDDFDPVTFLALLISRTEQLTGVRDVGIVLTEPAGLIRTMTASTERSRSITRLQAEHAEGPCHDCRRSARAVVVDELALERARWPRVAPVAFRAGFRSVLAVPLQHHGTVVGVVQLLAARPAAFVPETRALVQALGDIATIGLLQHVRMLRTRSQLTHLEHALHSRIVIEQAKGIVAAQAGVAVDCAFELLRRHSRDHNRRLRDVARAIIDGAIDARELSS
jgi:GAF domain-containing protein